MSKRFWIVFLVFAAGCATATTAPAPEPAPRFRVVGYVSGRTNFEAIDARNLTHLNYAFAKVRGDDVVYFEERDAAEDLARLRALEAVNPDLKVILSVGGWGAEWFSDAALTADARCRFATSAVALVKEHRLDGIDIDWEYPGQPGAGNRHRPEDKQNFTLLLEELRRELGGGYILTIASGAGRWFRYVEIERVAALVDWFNVMSYDMASGSSPATGHHAPLHANPRAADPPPAAHRPPPARSPAGLDERSTAGYVRQYLDAGVPPEKIVVGVPFYGRTWKWVWNRRSETGLNEGFDWFGPDVGYASLRFDQFKRGWDEVAKAPYLWDPENGTFISYEDPRSVAEKARFIRENHLGGVMYWEHRHDPSQQLLSAVASVLLPRPEEPLRTRGDRGSPDRTASDPGSADSRGARPGSGSRR